jgi:hypothetical protein
MEDDLRLSRVLFERGTKLWEPPRSAITIRSDSWHGGRRDVSWWLTRQKIDYDETSAFTSIGIHNLARHPTDSRMQSE